MDTAYSNEMKKIVAIGFNPALQRTLVLETVNVGGVNRASEVYVSPGGKAIHFARSVQTLFPGSVIPAYFAGGSAGQHITDTLAKLGVESLVVNVQKETRTCTTILDRSTHEATEFVGVSAPVTRVDADRMKAKLLETIPDADALAVCGTYPAGIDEAFLLELLECHGDRPVLVDAYRGMNQVLRSGRVSILKINLDEARELSRLRNVKEIGDHCLDHFGLSALMITDGSRPAYLMTPEKCLQFTLECISFVNPIGAGDTCAGVMFSSYLNGDDIEHAFSKGLAAASASCLHYEGAVFSVSEMQKLVAGITVRDY